MGALDQYNARTRRLLTDAQKQYWSDRDLNDNINEARVRVAGDTKCLRKLVTQILREAEEIDTAEDELYGDARGDELPEQLRTPDGRRQALADAKRRLAERRGIARWL